MTSSRPLPEPGDRDAEVAALEARIAKLEKINAALMDRIERSNDLAGNAFSMFETAIALEAKVRERTGALEDALARLAQANANLAATHAAAHAAQTRLRDAIDSINEGFILFDADDRLVLFNEAYLSFWPELTAQLREGMTFDEIARLVVEIERPVGSLAGPDRWVSERLARHGIADGGHVQALADGRWVQINELRTSEGGIVGIYTDITEVKAEDARERTRELAERNLLLQSTLDNLSEGVCMFDAEGRLSAWNDALERLLRLPEGWSKEMPDQKSFVRWCREILNLDDEGCLDWTGEATDGGRANRLCSAGDEYFEVRSTASVRGGQVISFTDVTAMIQAQAVLRGTAETLERRVLERMVELRTVNTRLEAEVAERRQIEAQLLEAKTAAEKANLSKTSFLAAASHDLLQPLNAARLFVAALGDRRLALPTRALVNQTSTALDSVEDLLESLLEISRLDAGAIQPEITDFRLDQLLDTLMLEFRPMAKGAGLALTVESGTHWVRSDIRLLRRILQNLISNAIRYTAQGSVTIRSVLDHGHVRISVIDTGSGIAVDKQAAAFEEFRRLDTRQPGKGLGLAIVRRASDMLGHDVAVRSAPGQGSTFSVAVPQGTPRPETAPSTGSASRDRSMHDVAVLVIDNERSIQTGMATLLGGWGCAVRTAAGRAEALTRYLPGEAPDVILVDYHLSEHETGDRTVATLRDHFGDDIPAVMISADRSVALKSRMDALGIPLLGKPVKPAQLRALLRTVIR